MQKEIKYRSKKDYFKIFKGHISNLQVKKILDLAGIDHKNNYTQNLSTLSAHVQQKADKIYDEIRARIKDKDKFEEYPAEYFQDSRFVTSLLSSDEIKKMTILDPKEFLPKNQIKTQKELFKQIEPEKREKIENMINDTHNYELLQATIDNYNYDPIINKDIVYTSKSGKEIGYLGKDEIIIKEPEDIEGYLQAKVNQIEDIHARQEGKASLGDLDGEPYYNYYSKFIESTEDIFEFLDYVYDKERKPFKLHFSFGCIYEEESNSTDNRWNYIFVNANPFIVKRSIPAVINGIETLTKYKQYIINTIEEAKEITYISTKHRWISIVNVLFSVYRMMPAQGKLDFLPEEILKNRSLCHYNEDNNLCFWAAYGAYMITQEKRINKNRGLNINKLTTEARKYLQDWFLYKNVIPNTVPKKYENTTITPIDLISPAKINQLIRDYSGFDLCDIQDFANWANCNVNIYDYDEDCKSYTIFKTYTVPKPKFEVPFNILLLTHGCKNHIMYIKDTELLCGILICPKCNSYCYNKKAKSANKFRFDIHVKNCTGKCGKTLRLDKVAHPYCPHLWKTNYSLLLSHRESEYWKPTKYYMTFDFETMEQKMEKKITDKTCIHAKIIPLSVALSIYSPKGIKTFWFSRKDMSEVEMIVSFLRCIFANYDEVYEANIINTPTQCIEPKHINIIGYNSGKFDLNLLLPYLNDPFNSFRVVDMIGTSNSFKCLRVSQHKKIIRFIDAMNYVTPQPLRDFIQNFGSTKCPQKGFFAYEAFDSTNYKTILAKSEPFSQNDFYSDLTKTGISNEDYKMYLQDAKQYKTRWEYLEFYNKLDTISMIDPINNLIERTSQYKVDMLSNLSLSANSSNTKYALAYKDFDPYANYGTNQKTTFRPTKQWWKNKCKAYMDQDLAKGRDVSHNVSIEDYEYFRNLFMTEKCYLCNEGFTYDNTPTLDRIDNSKGHSKDNVKVCCKYCNTLKSDRSEEEARLYVNLKKYCKLHNLPMTITNDDVYHLLRRGITGGMSNVLHRLNIKGETPINHLIFEDKKIKSIDDPDKKVTHITGIDFNSLYPSVYSSNEHPFIPYTDHKMYMPGSVMDAFKCNDIFLKQKARRIIESRDTLFVADIRGYIPREYWNEFINLPPIWRNVTIKTDEKTLGPYMYNYIKDNKLMVDTKSKKLTMLLSTHPNCRYINETNNGESKNDSTESDQDMEGRGSKEALDAEEQSDEGSGYMIFSSYYLWFLLDRCHFVIEDVRYIVTFTKHTGFNNFVNIFMQNRQEAIVEKNKGLDMFCKISLNGSYGYDGMNSEKFTKAKIQNKNRTFKSQLSDTFLSTRKISDDNYIVESESKTFSCNTCIQEAFFTLDNAKYWYLNFVYNFMYKAFDMSRIHFVEGDTDSMYWAISGDPNRDCHQGFDAVIKDKMFYEKNAKYFFPIIDQNMSDLDKIRQEKKLLGLSIEREADNCIALAPKCYTLWDNNDSTSMSGQNKQNVKAMKVKGIKKNQTDITYEDYLEVLTNNTVKSGKNMNLQIQDGVMSKISVYKNALTCAHTKMRVLKNQSCVPFV